MTEHREGSKPLAILAGMAEILDSDRYHDTVSPAQQRAIRQLADDLRADLESMLGVPLSAQHLVVLLMGMELQLKATARGKIETLLHSMVDTSDTPSAILRVAVAYLARDVLAGERVP